MDSDRYLIIIAIFIIFLLGAIAGYEASDETLRKEIEQYNYIRFDGVHYYPEEVLENEQKER